MLLSILFFLISLVPSVLFFVFLRRRRKDEPLYKKKCTYAVVIGLLCALPIIVVSGTLYLLNGFLKLTVLKDMPALVYQAIYNFIVLAFAEELVKYLCLRLTLRKKLYAFTWADIVAFMVIIGTGFGINEAIVYAIGADPMTMLVRGLTMGHVGYGFIMGWFYGKRLYTGKKRYAFFAIIIPWVLHGTYDFSLSQEFMAINDNLFFVAFILAILDIVLVILTIRFFIRVRKHKNERCHQPLFTLEENTVLK